MWSRPKIKTTTIDKFRVYAEKHGLKLWMVFEKAIDNLNKE
jgi:putative ribosome biogenesis GTPase RsgA